MAKDIAVWTRSYATGTPGSNASMAIKWVAQTVQPLAMPDARSQPMRLAPADAAASWRMRTDVIAPNTQMVSPRIMSWRSCAYNVVST